ncbi:MAG: tetratricopeptide repeat protein [Thermoguttaceae bacterium]|nr:tetratricopeptide repeat protein [Thermoguttaceae bacterium]MBQ7110088.1 tetratricopeptide repeat protein [Thermoguttaceae bacterium]
MLAARPFVSRASRTLALLLALGFCVDATSPSAFAQNAKPRAAASANKSAPRTAQVAQAPSAPRPAATPTAPVADAPKLSAAEEAKYQEALQRFNSQNLAGALASLRELAASNPAATPPRLILARWFAELQNPKAVRTSLELATEESPNDPEAFLSLAEIAFLEGSLTSAELLTLQGQRVLARYDANPTRKQNLTRKALTLQLAYSNARRRWPAAQEAILALIKLDGETAELDRALGRVLFQQNQEDKAREMFARADKLTPADAASTTLPADALLSQLYAERGDLVNAKKYLDAALKASPKSVPTLVLSISTALEENDLETAWTRARQLYANDKSADVLKIYGKVALFRSDYSQAEAAFQEVVRQNPLDAEAVAGLALALCEQDDAEKRKRAVQYATSNVQKQANNRDYLATLGWTLYRSGETDAAIQVLQQSVADGQINAAAAYYFAVALVEKGQTEAAKQLLNAALATKPPFAKRVAAAALAQQLKSTPAQPQK